MGEDRPFLELELAPAAGRFHDDVRPEDVRRHEVGRELDAVEGEVEHLTQRADEERLAQTRHAFEQDVAAGKQGDERALDNFILADQGLADLGAQARVRFAEGLDQFFGVHWETVFKLSGYQARRLSGSGSLGLVSVDA